MFDFDGLLMDTESTQLESWQYEWRQHGLELDVATFFADHGGDVSELRYATLASAVGAGYDRVSSHARRVAYRDSLNAVLQFRPGIQAWLDAASGFRLAVASSSPASWVLPLLEQSGYRSRFEVVACGDEVSAHKPDPAVYYLALERLGIVASEAMAFEDTPHGVAAAKAAGLRCVAIPNPHTDASLLGAADRVLGSAEEMTLAEVISQ
ncbi:HAD-IA family hydrolase [Kibdelosporangium philippinense]|uniref:HAD-IA family hydrolase n=1 Tax=Kibdelosporangium philippinense TaxID=211113 RepID=UPI003607A07D